MQDKARAYNSKLREGILIQYSEFLSTLIAEPALIRQIQAQVKIGPRPNGQKKKDFEDVGKSIAKRAFGMLVGDTLRGISNAALTQVQRNTSTGLFLYNILLLWGPLLVEYCSITGGNLIRLR